MFYMYNFMEHLSCRDTVWFRVLVPEKRERKKGTHGRDEVPAKNTKYGMRLPERSWGKRLHWETKSGKDGWYGSGTYM